MYSRFFDIRSVVSALEVGSGDFFCFKQKTAYEMRISDWSSDVCSSDLPQPLAKPDRGRVAAMLAADAELDTGPGLAPARRRDLDQFADEIGRASCRERVCQYV